MSSWTGSSLFFSAVLPPSKQSSSFPICRSCQTQALLPTMLSPSHPPPLNSVSTRLNRPLTLLAITLPPKLSYYATRHASPCLLRAYTLMLNTFSHPILIILISSTVPYRNRNRTAALLARSLFESYRQTDTDSSNTFSPSPQVIPPVHVRNTRPH